MTLKIVESVPHIAIFKSGIIIQFSVVALFILIYCPDKTVNYGGDHYRYEHIFECRDCYEILYV